MKLHSNSITAGQRIPGEFAFGQPATEGHMSLSDNRNPHLAWSDAPEGTQSFALICVDDDVPTKIELVNQEDQTIPRELERCDFYHWVMVDIPTDVNEIDAGSCAEGAVVGGKRDPSGPGRQGLNDYTGFMGDGDYFGYDGPCPPWNDERLHHYHFRLYALDVPSLPVEGAFTGQQVEQAMSGHVLAQAEITGTYSLNPSV